MVNYNFEECVLTLAPFQQDLIRQLLECHTCDEALDIWLVAAGPDNTAEFGGDKKNDRLKFFKQEFYKLISEDIEYQTESTKFKEYASVSSVFLVSWLSSVLSAHLGVVASIISPLVVLGLGAIAKMGIKAFREKLRNEIEN